MPEFDLKGKYPTIHSKGLKVIKDKDSNPKEFTGFNPNLRDTFTTALRYTPETTDKFIEKIVSPLKEAGGASGIEMVYAGIDYPLHTTLLLGKYIGDESGRLNLYAEVSRHSSIVATREKLIGKNLEYPFIIIDGANILLGARITEEITGLRNQLTAVYSEFGLEPISIKELLHISAARIKTPFTLIGSSERDMYIKSTRKLRRELSKNPLSLQVVGVAAMSTYKLLTGNE